MDAHCFNIGITGGSGNGKTSLLNGLRGLKDNNPLAGKIGAVETTMIIKKYAHPFHPSINLWDLPGAGT